MKALYFILGLFSREAPGKVKEQKALTEKELTEKELTEQEALEILENTDCPFLKHVYTHFQRAYEASSENERRCKLALANSAVKKSQFGYSVMGLEIPKKYLSAVQILLLGFEKREQVRRDLLAAYRLAIQDGSADPLL